MREAWGSEPCRLLITFSPQPMSTGFASMTNGPATCQIVDAPSTGGHDEGRRRGLFESKQELSSVAQHVNQHWGFSFVGSCKVSNGVMASYMVSTYK